MTSLGEPDPSVINKKDILSAVAFNATGKLLAVGDHAGRCILFERQNADANNKQSFDYLCEFQAHKKQIDVLSNQEIPDTVNDICWLSKM